MRHGTVLRPRTWTLGRSGAQAPAAASVFTCSHAWVTAAAATEFLVVGRGPTILPSLPRAPKAGIFFAFSLPEATEAAAGVFTDAHPRGVTGLIAQVITYSSPKTTGAVTAVDTYSFTKTAEVVTAASVPRVAGSGPSGFRDAHTAVFADSSPRVAGIRARVAAALAAVTSHSHPWAALPMSIVSPNSLLRDTAVRA